MERELQELGRDRDDAMRADDPRRGETGEGRPARPCSVRDMTPQELGARGEEMAANYLERKGWELLERNWRCGFGEVDIIAREEEFSDTVVLVEVKTRLALGGHEGMPELAVDEAKRERYRMCALAYLMQHGEVRSIRFDVIALNVMGEGGARLRHLFGAYSMDS